MRRFFPKTDEARDRVAAEVLNVAPSLLGQPLARPLRRAAAMLVDLVLIATVSALANVWLLLSLVTLGIGWERRQRLAAAPRWLWWGLLAAVFAVAGVWQLITHPVALPAAPAVEATGAAPQGTQDVETTLRAVADEIGLGYGWSLVYFTLLPAWWPGQTVGKRCFGLAVVELTGKPTTLLLNLKRYGGYAAGLATGGLGLAQVWWDRNRQGIQDKAAHTVVIDLRQARAATPQRLP